MVANPMNPQNADRLTVSDHAAFAAAFLQCHQWCVQLCTLHSVRMHLYLLIYGIVQT